jgi:hypothetical protein
MDTTTPSRRGRPPAPVPTMPLFLGAARSRVKREIAMSAATSRELDSYIDWASARAMMPGDEVLVRIFDHALVEYIKKDAAWQNDRAEFIDRGATKSTPPKTDVAPPPVAPARQEAKSAVLPPPPPTSGKGA